MLRVFDTHIVFITYLEKITPKQECLDLFKDVVLDVWNGKFDDIKKSNELVDKQLKPLEKERQNIPISKERYL